jgi:hypothetical protein
MFCPQPLLLSGKPKASAVPLLKIVFEVMRL